MKRLAKVSLFIGLGIFLVSRLLNGSLNFYIHPRFNLLTVLTAVCLVAVGVNYALSQHQANHNEHEHDHDHEHNHDVSWIGLLLLALPVLLGFFVKPQPLGAAALGNREVSAGSLTSAQAPESSRLTMLANAGERNILDWLYLFQASPDLGEFEAEKGHVIGFVYKDDRFSGDQFMVSRFTVSCCVADANPIGLIVRWPETAALQSDEWVDVEGHFEIGTFNGTKMPILVADRVSKTEPPDQPYLYQ
jgi:putative membrane protein